MKRSSLHPVVRSFLVALLACFVSLPYAGAQTISGKLDKIQTLEIISDALSAGSSRSNVVISQDDDLTKKLEKLRQYVSSIMKDAKVPGLAMAIVKDGEVIFAEGFGYRDKEKELPVTRKTLFAIGSCTKAFTTAAIGILSDEGSVEWNKPVRTYLPSFQLKDDYITENMTVRDLVTHRSGLPRHDALWYGAAFTRKEMFDRLRYLEFSAGFRERFQYNNLMFMTAGYLVGQVTNGTWEQFVKNRLFKPLGMTNSNFSVEDSKKADDFAEPYRIDDDKVEKISFRNIDEVGPAGSINSCIDDMVKWVQFHIDRGKVGEDQIISASEIQNMHTPHMHISFRMRSSEQSHASYGLGWRILMYRGHKLVRHGGGIDGFRTSTSFMPFDSIGVFVVNNAASPISSQAARYAYDLLLDLEPVDRYAKMKEAQEKAEEEEEKKEERVEGTQPSHPLKDYAGRFEHPGYGVITVAYNADGLSGEFNTLDFTLEHWHYDVFTTTDDLVFRKLKVSFYSNKKGDIDRIAVQLEPNLDDIIFMRKAAEELSGAEYLSTFAGEYAYGAMTITVELRNDVLVAMPTGQPTIELVPYKENEFTFKDLSGFSTKFILKNGKAVEMVLYQPNGVFTAKRVK